MSDDDDRPASGAVRPELEELRLVPVAQVLQRLAVLHVAPGGDARQQHRLGAEEQQGQVKLAADGPVEGGLRHAQRLAVNMPAP